MRRSPGRARAARVSQILKLDVAAVQEPAAEALPTEQPDESNRLRGSRSAEHENLAHRLEAEPFQNRRRHSTRLARGQRNPTPPRVREARAHQRAIDAATAQRGK